MARWSGALGGGALGFILARRWARSRRFDYAGKVVLITGASRGLGLVLARRLAKAGAHLSICARDEETLARAAEELRELGAEVIARICDVRQRDQVEAWVDDTVAHFRRIDVLINNAGTIQVGPADEMTLEDYEDALGTHFWGPLHASLAALPHMRSLGEGRIVNVTSIGGRIAVPHLLPYSASKFAELGLSEGLRAEYERDGILVTTVVPGLMRTGSPRNALFKGQREKEYAWFIIGDSLPVLSVSAERAAAQILSAAARGQAELVIGGMARLAALVHGVMPGTTQRALALGARLLPKPAGLAEQVARGREVETRWSRSVLTALTRRAEVRNNERDVPVS